jgi:hypothetical protein
MTASVRDLITVLEMFFPSELPLNRAIYVLITLAAIFPIIRLHNHQVSQPQQPRRTAWLKSIGAILNRSFNTEDLDPYGWIYSRSGDDYATDMHNDIDVLYEFLGLDNNDDPTAVFSPKSRPIICTSRVDCIICEPGPRPNTLRLRTKMQTVRVLDPSLTWVNGDLFVAHCPSCRSDYYPDRITYRSEDGARLQKLEFDATYFRISKHGVWAHKRLALVQEKALFRFHAGWSNFADWVNDVIKGPIKMTYRQSQRLFIENFSHRLLVAHGKQNTFTCTAHPSSQLLTNHVRAVIGCNGGSVPSAMDHGCLDCTHVKRYRVDLVNEGANLGESVDGVAVDGGNDSEVEDGTVCIFIECPYHMC